MDDRARLALIDGIIANWGDDHPEGLAAAKKQRLVVLERLKAAVTRQAAVTEPVTVATEGGQPPGVVVQLRTLKMGVKAPVGKKKAKA